MAATAAPARTPAADAQADLVAKLAASSASCDRIAAAHRLNEMFTWHHKRADAERLAGELCSAPLCEALVQLITDGEELCEIALHLMLNLCVCRGNAQQLCQAGILPVLIASLRVAEPQFLLPGLALLSVVAEERELAPSLLRAGVCKLISSLASKLPPGDFHWLLEIAEAVLHTPTALRPQHSQQLLKAFEPTALRLQAGELKLDDRDARRLSRVLGLLKVTSTAIPKHLLAGGSAPVPVAPPVAPTAWS